MRKKKRNGTSFALPLFAFLIPAVLLHAAPGEKKKPEPAAYGLVAGTVFQESGYALPERQHRPGSRSPARQRGGQGKEAETISDARGEFVFRVPAAPMRYTVKVTAKGFQPQQKSVTIQSEERIDVTFQLPPESKR